MGEISKSLIFPLHVYGAKSTSVYHVLFQILHLRMAAVFQRLEPFNGGQKFSDRKSQGVSHFHPVVTASCFCMSSLYCSSVPDIENLNLETRQCSVARAELRLA